MIASWREDDGRMHGRRCAMTRRKADEGLLMAEALSLVWGMHVHLLLGIGEESR
jgi:hypothetical protein